jgi:hypothetical protein
VLGFSTFRLALAGGVLALLLGVYGVQALRLAHAHADADRARAAVVLARADLKTCHDNAATLNASLDHEKAAVVAAKAEGDARVAVSVKAASAARAVAESYRRAEQAALAAKRTTPDACADADRLILEHVR